MKRILIVGKTGQIGWELMRSFGPTDEVIGVGRETMDLARPKMLDAAIRRIAPDVVINAAAYTAVDRAESEPELAMRINGEAPGVMARTCAELGAYFLHYSTDYVFDGLKGSPYLETDVPNPQSSYGRSKLAGERAVLAAGGRSTIVRTAWVYGSRGKNFLLTVLRLANELKELRVVADQFGTPTWSRVVAQVTAQIIQQNEAGLAARRRPIIVHLTCCGTVSWQGFAAAIIDSGAKLGLCRNTPVVGITTTEYPTPAPRPKQSRLDTCILENEFELRLPPWDRALMQCMDELTR